MKPAKARSKRATICSNILISAAILMVASGVCLALSYAFDDNNPYATSVFILAIALISRFTSGYIYGIVSSLIGVFCVNYMFTYPFWHFDLALYGYPLTFCTMLLVSILISALTTRIKQQESLRLEAEKEKMRANLLRSVSHDIRTPLSSIVGSSSVLLEDNEMSAQERRELIEEIHKSSNWLIRLTENILSVTRLNGVISLKKTDEVAEEVVGSAIVKFRKNHQSIQVTVTRPEEILLVPMDAVLIEQVLLNLLENAAIHATGATRIKIAISADESDAYFSVSDDGAGIAPHMLAHIFDVYPEAGSEPGSPDRRNAGIGLSACKAIIRAHDGELFASNNPEGGATFEFNLPMNEE